MFVFYKRGSVGQEGCDSDRDGKKQETAKLLKLFRARMCCFCGDETVKGLITSTVRTLRSFWRRFSSLRAEAWSYIWCSWASFRSHSLLRRLAWTASRRSSRAVPSSSGSPPSSRALRRAAGRRALFERRGGRRPGQAAEKAGRQGGQESDQRRSQLIVSRCVFFWVHG